MRVAQALIVSSLLVSAACGKEPLSHADAKEAFRTLSRAAPGMGADEALAVGQKLACENGGHVRVLETPNPDSDKARIKVAYENCSSRGTTINGTYGTEITFPRGAAMDTNSQVSVHITGALTFSGKVTGECDVDMATEMQLSSPESAKATGSFCGQNVATL